MADVVIIGAGLSGLMAARRILTSDAAASVIVLEARDRVGGRMYAQQVGAGGAACVDLGGQWIGAEQATLQELAKALGIELFESYASGNTVLRYNGRRHLDDDEITAPNSVDRRATRDLLEALTRTADLVVPDASRPWASPLASAYDRMTIGQWIDATSDNDYARFYAGLMATFDQPGGSTREVSLLHSLFETKANPSSAEPEKYLFRGAAGQIPPLLAGQIGGGTCVQTDSRVVSIHQATEGVRVGAVTPLGYQEFDGQAVIVAIPPWLAGAIRYTSSVPGQADLPARRLHLTQRMAMGTIAKVACIYDRPWWRTSGEGLSGTSYSQGTLVGVTADSGLPGEEGPGILTSFIQGQELFQWIGQSVNHRREMILQDLVDLFGADSRNPEVYVEALWPQDQFAGGAYNGYLPPGGWTSYGSALREPFGRISWAGTETAIEWVGYFEGAAVAGERAADEVIATWL